MTTTLSIFLYIYFAFLVFWFLFSLAGVYHMFKFGFKNFITFFTTFVFIGVSIVLLVASYSFIIEIDWKAEINLFKDMFGSKIPFN